MGEEIVESNCKVLKFGKFVIGHNKFFLWFNSFVVFRAKPRYSKFFKLVIGCKSHNCDICNIIFLKYFKLVIGVMSSILWLSPRISNNRKFLKLEISLKSNVSQSLIFNIFKFFKQIIDDKSPKSYIPWSRLLF